MGLCWRRWRGSRRSCLAWRTRTGIRGAVTVGVDAKLSQSFQSIGVSVSITLPVPNMTDLSVAKRAVTETKAMLDSQLADFVVELKEALPALAKK